jgi:ribosomal-protein-alanine N-acetyltransferase
MLPIYTDRLLIRQFLPSDYKALYDYLSQPSTYIFEPGQPISIDEAKMLSEERSKSLNFLAVILKTDNKLIGHIYNSIIEPKSFNTYEIGYIFNPPYHNQGYATEASKAIIQYIFKELKGHRIIANCNPENTASLRVLEKCGMIKEAHFRKNACFKKDSNDEPIWTDSYQYAILNEDAKE